MRVGYKGIRSTASDMSVDFTTLIQLIGVSYVLYHSYRPYEIQTAQSEGRTAAPMGNCISPRARYIFSILNKAQTNEHGLRAHNGDVYRYMTSQDRWRKTMTQL